MQPETCHFFWSAADDSKVCIHGMLPTDGPELDIMLPSTKFLFVYFSIEVD